jgi:hypothetical protein
MCWAVSARPYWEIKRFDQASKVWTFLEGPIKVKYIPDSMELDHLVEHPGRRTIPALTHKRKPA